MRTITCRLDTIQADLQASSPADVGGAATQKRLLGQVGAVHRTVDSAGTPGSARAKRRFRRAGRQLKLFINAVARGRSRGKIAAAVGDEILGVAGQARGMILPLGH